MFLNKDCKIDTFIFPCRYFLEFWTVREMSTRLMTQWGSDAVWRGVRNTYYHLQITVNDPDRHHCHTKCQKIGTDIDFTIKTLYAKQLYSCVIISNHSTSDCRDNLIIISIQIIHEMLLISYGIRSN